jgi:hypothetical protein
MNNNMTSSTTRRFTRRQKGQSLFELVAGLMVFVPIILLLIDCAVIMMGVSINDAACHDAARAASSGPPATSTSGAEHPVGPASSPYKRALTVVKDVYSAGGLVRISHSLSVREALSDPVPQVPTGGPVIGQVTVQTTASVSPPFLLRVFVENGVFEFKNTQRYPYTYVMPSS